MLWANRRLFWIDVPKNPVYEPPRKFLNLWVTVEHASEHSPVSYELLLTAVHAAYQQFDDRERRHHQSPTGLAFECFAVDLPAAHVDPDVRVEHISDVRLGRVCLRLRSEWGNSHFSVSVSNTIPCVIANCCLN